MPGWRIFRLYLFCRSQHVEYPGCDAKGKEYQYKQGGRIEKPIQPPANKNPDTNSNDKLCRQPKRLPYGA